MIADLWKVIRSTWYFAIREYRRRAQLRNRVADDPFTPAIENTVKRIIKEQS